MIVVDRDDPCLNVADGVVVDIDDRGLLLDGDVDDSVIVVDRDDIRLMVVLYLYHAVDDVVIGFLVEETSCEGQTMGCKPKTKILQ